MKSGRAVLHQGHEDEDQDGWRNASQASAAASGRDEMKRGQAVLVVEAKRSMVSWREAR